MFKLFTRAAWLGCCIGVVMSGADALAEATVSLKAVKINGVAIPGGPTNEITVAVNDTITAELRFSGWGNPPFDNGFCSARIDLACTRDADCGADGPCNLGGVYPRGLINTYQAQVNGKMDVQSSGPDHGLVLPNGWDAPLIKDLPPCDDPLYTVVTTQHGCVGTTFNRDLLASIDFLRTDYLFFGFDTVRAVADDSLDFRWGGDIADSDGPPDAGGSYYGGTYNLRAMPYRTPGQACVRGSNPGVSCTSDAVCRVCVDGSNPGTQCTSNAQCTGGGTCPAGGTCVAYPARPAMCGRFTFNLVNDITLTFIANPVVPPMMWLPLLEPLVINGPPCPTTGGACCNENTGVCTDGVDELDCQGPGMRFGGDGSTCAKLDPPCTILPNRIVSSDPRHCAIDARIPFLQGQPTQRRGFQSIKLMFERTAGTTEDSAGDYTVQTFGTAQGFPPVISNVVLNGNVATINFVNPIPTKKWSCVLHNVSNTRRCWGGLPADANGDHTAAPVDILDIIDNLNGVTDPPLAIYQCDIDRSALCAPADILTEIDLLNGASGWPPANGTTIDVVCPSTTGP